MLGPDEKRFAIWVEGYSCTGDHGVARFVGTGVGRTFQEACQEYFRRHPSKTYDPIRNTDWGCRLFDNPEDARRSFG